LKRLRILLCSYSRPFKQSDGPYITWTTQFLEGLESLDCEVIEPQTVDLIEPFLRRSDEDWLATNRVQLAEKLLDEVKALHQAKPIDLIICYFWSFQIDSQGVKAITNLGIPTVNFFCDNTRDIKSVSSLFRSFTLHWVPEVSALPFYQKAGIPFIHLPMGASPTQYSFQERPETKRVIFMGSADTLRRHLLCQVRDKIPLRIGGRGWKKQDENHSESSLSVRSNGVSSGQVFRSHLNRLLEYGVAGEWRHFQLRHLEKSLKHALSDLAIETRDHPEMLEQFWGNAVTLGINRFPIPSASLSKPQTYSRLRDLEAPMAGAVYLTEWTDDLPLLFDLEN
jgi:hypothetical protein